LHLLIEGSDYAKTIIHLFIVLFSVISAGLCAQILATERGPVRYFKTLDSGESVRLNHIASKCFCFLRIEYSTRQKLLKLDLKTDSSRSDDYFTCLASII